MGPRPVQPALDPHSARHMLLQLQRTAGNAAVDRLLQRMQASSGGSHRDDAARAVARPVPAAATSMGGAAAVVQRQETGIAAPKAVAGASSEMQALIDDKAWAAMDKGGRARAMVEAASKQLVALGGPRITHLFGQQGVTQGGSEYGAFMPATGMMILNEKPFADNSTRPERIGAAGTVYHEVRHAEQFYRVARLLAGEGIPAGDIAKRLGLVQGTADLATQHPLAKPKDYGKQHKSEEKRLRDAEYGEAVAWRGVVDKGDRGKSVYEEVSEKMSAAQIEYGTAHKNLNMAFAAFKQDLIAKKDLDQVVGEFRQAWTTYKGMYMAYHMTPVERDAWKVGGGMEHGLGGDPNTMEKELSNLPGNPEQHTFMPTMEPIAPVSTPPVSPVGTSPTATLPSSAASSTPSATAPERRDQRRRAMMLPSPLLHNNSPDLPPPPLSTLLGPEITADDLPPPPQTPTPSPLAATSGGVPSPAPERRDQRRRAMMLPSPLLHNNSPDLPPTPSPTLLGPEITADNLPLPPQTSTASPLAATSGSLPSPAPERRDQRRRAVMLPSPRLHNNSPDQPPTPSPTLLGPEITADDLPLPPQTPMPSPLGATSVSLPSLDPEQRERRRQAMLLRDQQRRARMLPSPLLPGNSPDQPPLPTPILGAEGSQTLPPTPSVVVVGSGASASAGRRDRRGAGQFSPSPSTEDTIQGKHVQRHAVPEELQAAMQQDDEIAGVLAHES